MERYESLGLVGEGSYGTVLKCRHRESGRLVAIKKFVDSDDDKTVKKIALREIKLLRQLRHDNLVNLLEVWKRRRRWYLVFEFVERTLLDDLEQNPSGLDLNTSRRYLYQILRAAAFCHQQNIIHRDIKPENILISQGGVVKICDFGFARTMAAPAEGVVYTDYVATRWYRAPELLVGDTKPVDVWAVGCLLLEMLTGQPLFPGDSDLDQIYHIVRCFGNLTAHHQELFCRNPVFSGVTLPEYSARVRLEQRFPTIAPAAQDLALSCLQMDPERRAQCSELQEHPLFTQDSFHIRFLDELNAKIQKDHRENSTFPKISKTPRRERNEGDDKNRQSKEKKQPEGVHEKVNKETKGKQPLKLSKTIRNTSEPSMSTKQAKTSGAKMINIAAKTTVVMRGKAGKATIKTLNSDSLEVAKTATDLKDSDTVAAEPKHVKVASPEPRQDHVKTMDTKDRDSSSLHFSYSDYIVSSVTERNVMGIRTSSKSEPSQDFGKSQNNSTSKVPKLSKSSITDHANGSLSPKASMTSTTEQKMTKFSTSEYLEGASAVTSKIANSDQVETSLTFKASQPSSNDHIEVATPTIPSVTKPCKITITSEHHSNMETKQRGPPECPKVFPSNPRPPKTNSNFGPKITQNNTSFSNSPSKTLTSDVSRQSSTVVIEASPVHSTTTLPKGTSNTMLSKTSSSSNIKPTNDTACVPNKPSRGLPDRELTEVSIATKTQQDSCNTSNKDLKEDHGCLKMSPATKTAANQTEISDASGGHYKGSPEFLEPSSVHQNFTSEFRTTSTSMLNEIPKTNASGGTAILKTLKVSDKENREDLALPGSISATTKSLINQTSKVSRSSNIEQKRNGNKAQPDVKPVKPPHFKSLIGDPKKPTKSNATMTLKKTTFPTEARKKSDNPGSDDTTNISTIADSTSFTSTATPDPKASTRSSVFHNRDTADDDEFDFSVHPSSPPPPPLPPSSTPLVPSFCVVSPAASDHLSLGAGFHSGTHSFRCVDHPRHHGGVYGRLSSHVTGSLSAQVSEKNLTSERSFLSDRCNLGNSGGISATKKKSGIHFPDLRSSVLPEVKGREGKHNKGTSKDQRKDKQPVPPSEPEQHGHNSTDTQTP
ncbi:serine/threonine-protein kinase BUR1-like isoform X1 [Anarrhichthys ocellatus]|uniref:serine/threonine-protein kinase BUR1-like isoform X1 n=1 Tax=Anarrhichthys ocellatus TaxID=433405 RepID=UPI0012EEB360|nr:serine/threonine-protein kinase BUR1-like isoform X1 [Anarrhichthys ocellatus]